MTCKPRQISGNLPFDAIPRDYNRYCDRIFGNGSGLFLETLLEPTTPSSSMSANWSTADAGVSYDSDGVAGGFVNWGAVGFLPGDVIVYTVDVNITAGANLSVFFGTGTTAYPLVDGLNIINITVDVGAPDDIVRIFAAAGVIVNVTNWKLQRK